MLGFNLKGLTRIRDRKIRKIRISMNGSFGG